LTRRFLEVQIFVFWLRECAMKVEVPSCSAALTQGIIVVPFLTLSFITKSQSA